MEMRAGLFPQRSKLQVTFPSKRKLAVYGLGTILGLSTLIWFFSDSTPPAVTNFALSGATVSIANDKLFSFSGEMRDDRGITEAQFECVSDEKVEFIIFIAMQGNDRNRVSFGRISGTANWTGRWSGSSYALEFEGLAPLTETFEPTNCDWFARLSDIVGNETYFDTGARLKITE